MFTRKRTDVQSVTILKYHKENRWSNSLITSLLNLKALPFKKQPTILPWLRCFYPLDSYYGKVQALPESYFKNRHLISKTNYGETATINITSLLHHPTKIAEKSGSHLKVFIEVIYFITKGQTMKEESRFRRIANRNVALMVFALKAKEGDTVIYCDERQKKIKKMVFAKRFWVEQRGPVDI